jgi:glutamate/tyrosine decarboxylase-like PLP-dependent enzyme
MSRRFRGLKVWAILKARGRRGIRAAIAHDIALREHLDRRIEEEPHLEALGSDLSISCFRFRPDDRSEDELTALNRLILETVVREGRAYMSPTTLDGRYSLRVCIVNYRTTEADIDLLVDEVLRIGRRRSRG